MKPYHLFALTLLLIPAAACQNGAMGTMIPTSTGNGQVVATGMWGGNDVGMDVMQTGATLEFDCANGSIDGPIQLDATGSFTVDGAYVQEQGGPVGGMGSPVPARYQGQVVGQQMTLTVTNLSTMVKIGAFSLTFGATGRVVKCL